MTSRPLFLLAVCGLLGCTPARSSVPSPTVPAGPPQPSPLAPEPAPSVSQNAEALEPAEWQTAEELRGTLAAWFEAHPRVDAVHGAQAVLSIVSQDGVDLCYVPERSRAAEGVELPTTSVCWREPPGTELIYNGLEAGDIRYDSGHVHATADGPVLTVAITHDGQRALAREYRFRTREVRIAATQGVTRDKSGRLDIPDDSAPAVRADEPWQAAQDVYSLSRAHLAALTELQMLSENRGPLSFFSVKKGEAAPPSVPTAQATIDSEQILAAHIAGRWVVSPLLPIPEQADSLDYAALRDATWLTGAPNTYMAQLLMCAGLHEYAVDRSGMTLFEHVDGTLVPRGTLIQMRAGADWLSDMKTGESVLAQTSETAVLRGGAGCIHVTAHASKPQPRLKRTEALWSPTLAAGSYRWTREGFVPEECR